MSGTLSHNKKNVWTPTQRLKRFNGKEGWSLEAEVNKVRLKQPDPAIQNDLECHNNNLAVCSGQTRRSFEAIKVGCDFHRTGSDVKTNGTDFS